MTEIMPHVPYRKQIKFRHKKTLEAVCDENKAAVTRGSKAIARILLFKAGSDTLPITEPQLKKLVPDLDADQFKASIGEADALLSAVFGLSIMHTKNLVMEKKNGKEVMSVQKSGGYLSLVNTLGQGTHPDITNYCRASISRPSTEMVESEEEAAPRGLLMLVLAMIAINSTVTCIEEETLLQRLEELGFGRGSGDSAQLPEGTVKAIASLCTRKYLTKLDKSVPTRYTYGPRAVAEVGMARVAQFVAGIVHGNAETDVAKVLESGCRRELLMHDFDSTLARDKAKNVANRTMQEIDTYCNGVTAGAGDGAGAGAGAGGAGE